jgi:hypothetical protein
VAKCGFIVSVPVLRLLLLLNQRTVQLRRLPHG